MFDEVFDPKHVNHLLGCLMPSMYLHIPFCEKKCVYCDFYSIETGSRMEDFLQSLHREIDLYAEYGDGSSFETIFFGGGTPSLLTPEQLGSLLAHIRSAYHIEADVEITVETNPGTVTEEKLAAYRELGVNRLSVGIQSFHEDELKFLSRIHDRDQAFRCIEFARAVGFENFSLDLIYALPGQSRERWEDNLSTALSLQPKHISAYGLIVEEGTPLAHMVKTRQVLPSTVEDEAGLYELTMETMERHGFEHYEVSNYAKPGYRSRHNDNYWRHENYLGFGPSAHSFWQRHGVSRRWWNIANLSHYCGELQKGRLPLISQEELTQRQLVTERIFLGLRSDGLDLRTLQTEYGVSLPRSRHSVIDQIVVEGLATLDGSSLRLTSKGFLLCDEICTKLLP